MRPWIEKYGIPVEKIDGELVIRREGAEKDDNRSTTRGMGADATNEKITLLPRRNVPLQKVDAYDERLGPG